jgi:hypothetical protein
MRRQDFYRMYIWQPDLERTTKHPRSVHTFYRQINLIISIAVAIELALSATAPVAPCAPKNGSARP